MIKLCKLACQRQNNVWVKFKTYFIIVKRYHDIVIINFKLQGFILVLAAFKF